MPPCSLICRLHPHEVVTGCALGQVRVNLLGIEVSRRLMALSPLVTLFYRSFPLSGCGLPPDLPRQQILEFVDGS